LGGLGVAIRLGRGLVEDGRVWVVGSTGTMAQRVCRCLVRRQETSGTVRVSGSEAVRISVPRLSGVIIAAIGALCLIARVGFALVSQIIDLISTPPPVM
jgi:hypothetical protein